MRPGRRATVSLLAAVTLTLSAAAAAAGVTAALPAYTWHEAAATYGVKQVTDVPVTMRDGTVLRVDVYYPTDAKTGAEAKGPFPVLLTQTPYGKGSMGDTYYVQRGYLEVVADVRGTGASHGSFGLFDPVQATDGATLVDWAARLPHSSGEVGLFGESYMAITQFMTAAALPKGSPLKALFPVVPGNDLYRDTAFQGGLIDGEFSLAYLGLTGGLNMLNPVAEGPHDPVDTAQLEMEHGGGLASYHATTLINGETGGDQAYDEAYWMARNPRTMLQKVVDNGIPAFMVGGWFDLFQRGEPLDFSGLQNAWAGRPVSAPMSPRQPVTGRYQLLMGPWYHLTAGNGINLHAIELEWFDTFLKHEPTGIDHTSTPLHVYQLGSGKWLDARTYPFGEATPTRLFLGAGNTLTAKRPSADKTAADPVVWSPASSFCDRQTEQWIMGAGTLPSTYGAPNDPCTQDDRTLQQGPGALTYTTPPLAAPRVLAGPIDATLFATTTTKDAEWVVTVEDVAPDGTSTPLTAGALLGSMRALDNSQTWWAAPGRPLLPYHPYTRVAQKPVTPGQVTRFDVEVFPTFAYIAKGHQIRVTLTTADTPHLMPNTTQLPNLVGGVYQVQRNAAAASWVELPLSAPSAYAATCRLCR
jgi:putative CocE/NonD family hydrolase